MKQIFCENYYILRKASSKNVSIEERSAVIMKNLVNSLAREYHFTHSCSGESAVARFLIIT